MEEVYGFQQTCFKTILWNNSEPELVYGFPYTSAAPLWFLNGARPCPLPARVGAMALLVQPPPMFTGSRKLALKLFDVDGASLPDAVCACRNSAGTGDAV